MITRKEEIKKKKNEDEDEPTLKGYGPCYV